MIILETLRARLYLCEWGVVVSMTTIGIPLSLISEEAVPGTGNKAGLGWDIDWRQGRELFSYYTFWHFAWAMLHGSAGTLPVVGVSQACHMKAGWNLSMEVPWGFLNVDSLSCRLWEKPYLIVVVNYFPCQWFKYWCAYISWGAFIDAVSVKWGH